MCVCVYMYHGLTHHPNLPFCDLLTPLIHTYAYIYAYIYIYTHIHLYIYTHIRTHTPIHIHTVIEKINKSDSASIKFMNAITRSVEDGGLAYTEKLRYCTGVTQLAAILSQEYKDMSKARSAIIRDFRALPEDPSEAELVEAGNCKVCRDYLFKTGAGACVCVCI